MVDIELYSGACPKCKNYLHHPTYEVSIECRQCNRYYLTESLTRPGETGQQPKAAPYQDVLCRELEKLVFREKKAETLQNTTWSCKEEKETFISQAIAPLVTHWGINKEKMAHRLTKLGNPQEFLDCTKILGKRAAQVSQEDAKQMNTNSKKRLAYTKNILQGINKESEVAVQVPVKGGGHGLFLAMSLALGGKEIFWHALQLNVFYEMRDKKQQYLSFRKDDTGLERDWDLLLARCDPNMIAKPDGKQEVNLIYLFALANVLKRPIVLLDGEKNDRKSGVFLPLFHPVKNCGKGGVCLVWADKQRTHVEPLLGIKECNAIQIPDEFIPPVWGADQSKLQEYCDIKATGGLVIKGKVMPESYVSDLTNAMMPVFSQENGIEVNFLTDVYRCVYRTAGLVNVPPPVMIDTIKEAMEDLRIYRCLDCRNISVMPEAVLPGGRLFTHAKSMTGEIQKEKKYCFILLGYQCQYDEGTDRLVAIKKLCRVLDCPWCEKKRIRKMGVDGEPKLDNGDMTRTGRFYWNGEEYDSNPKKIPIGLEWKGEVYPDTIFWFSDQKDPTLNSSVEGTIDYLVQKHFPDETDPKLRERVARIVKLRLSQQYDLDIPGIEKYKKPEFKPQIKVPDLDETSVMEVAGADRASGTVEGAVGSTTEVTTDAQQPQSEDDKLSSLSSDDDDEGLYIGEQAVPDIPSRVNTSRDSGAVPKQKKIKVQHHNKTDIIEIPYTLTFAELQKILESKVGIPVSRQHIKHGFPPKFITVPYENLHAPYTLIQNNDRLVVEDKPSGGSMPKETKKQSSIPKASATEARAQGNPTRVTTPPHKLGGADAPAGNTAPGKQAANGKKAPEKTPARTAPAKDSPAMKILLKLRKMLDDVNKSGGMTSAKLVQSVLENKDTEDQDAGGIIADLIKETDVPTVTEAVTLWRRSIQETKQSK